LAFFLLSLLPSALTNFRLAHRLLMDKTAHLTTFCLSVIKPVVLSQKRIRRKRIELYAIAYSILVL